MKSMIKNIIRRALITLGGDDDQDFPVQQITYLGKASDFESISLYGIHANLPANGECVVTIFSNLAEEDSRVGIGYTPRLRPKNLPEGEVVFYHPLTQSKMHYRNNGDIDLTVTGDNGDLNVTIKKDLNITVNGNANINVAGDATTTINGNAVLDIGGDASIDIDGTLNMTCPTTNWTGDINLTGKLDITGGLEVSADTTLSATVTSNGKDISDTHVHSGVTSGASNSGPPV